jgi:hypothetical protein
MSLLANSSNVGYGGFGEVRKIAPLLTQAVTCFFGVRFMGFPRLLYTPTLKTIMISCFVGVRIESCTAKYRTINFYWMTGKTSLHAIGLKPLHEPSELENIALNTLFIKVGEPVLDELERL